MTKITSWKVWNFTCSACFTSLTFWSASEGPPRGSKILTWNSVKFRDKIWTRFEILPALPASHPWPWPSGRLQRAPQRSESSFHTSQTYSVRNYLTGWHFKLLGGYQLKKHPVYSPGTCDEGSHMLTGGTTLLHTNTNTNTYTNTNTA